MNFRNFEDMAALIRRSLPKLPPKIDVVVGVPRSGLSPALLIGLYKNTMVTDVEGFLEGRAFAPGARRAKRNLASDPDAWRDVLVVDDSVDTGGTMAEVAAALASAGRGARFVFCAVYGAGKTCPGVDLVLEACPPPRLFEWNLVHHPDHMARACLDIDGVLCLDPTHEQNDDGPNYQRFLASAQPFLVPSVPIGTLVTSRLEKYRGETEAWLEAAGVQYGELCMLDLPSAAERRRRGAHVPFKAEVYASRPDAIVFVESEPHQAREIARRSGKPVVCTADMSLHSGSFLHQARAAATRAPRGLLRKLGLWQSAPRGAGGE